MFGVNKEQRRYRIFLSTGSIAILCFGLLRFGSYEPQHERFTRNPLECSDKEGPTYDEQGFEIINKDISCVALRSISDSYQTTIKPIFEGKCLMCHGEAKRLPLYALVHPASFLLKRDIREAKKHMNMTYDFPFKGHGSEVDDLRAIKKVIEQNRMPPWQYKLMHWQSTLTNYERQTILDWVDQSLKILESQKENRNEAR